jgi:hypothetical protein
MHRMLNLNKFKDSYQVLEKKSKILSTTKKIILKTHKECFNTFFCPEIFFTNMLCANVYKSYESDKNQVPYYNIKIFKKSNF